MKKERNSFFESSNFNMSAMGPNINMPNHMAMAGNMPAFNAASSNFYAAGNMPLPNTLPAYPNQNDLTNLTPLSELESRMAKLERNINRIEARLNKLEGSTYYTKETYETDGNMYMV